MDTSQIASILLSHPATSQVFRGVFPVDRLQSSRCGAAAGLYVCNTDPSDRPGQHWIVIAIAENARGFRHGEYFDSFGLPPLQPEFVKFLDKNTSSSSSSPSG